MSSSITVNDLVFEVRRSPRRKTLEITVDRGGELRVAAPAQVSDEAIKRFVREKRGWVYDKLAEKELMWKPRARREFVTGEGFPYLGRSYRLLLVPKQDRALKLEAGRFRLKRAEVRRGREHFVAWYTAHARAWAELRLPLWASRLGTEPAGVRVLDLGNRWGSCSKAGVVNLHWTTIQLPVSIVDYVLVHELAHLVEHGHDAAFWRLVERVLPDYISRKRWLAEQGQGFAGV